ncbi:glycosyltransferase [Mycobacterium sp. NPDC048908]|uniref:glycosyltransferase n=1 Tax=Mycobacterium sp. NPDC048908 TaxID=3364292 RepID=UPI003722B832
MATILAYTSPALGHVLPISAFLAELVRRGHTVHLHTLSAAVGVGRRLEFDTQPIDSRIEAIEHDDWQAPKPGAGLKRAFAVFGRRAPLEVTDLADAIARVNPDALLVDVLCWGALLAADAGSIPWACFSPFTPLLRAESIPPFGPGLKPLPNMVGRVRDTLIRAMTNSTVNSAVPALNTVREDLGLRPVRSMEEFWRRSPLMLVASGKPFDYPHADYGDAVQMIGPCALDSCPDVAPDWLASIERPIVLVTTSSEKQGDAHLVDTAMAALADEPVHVVATLPAGTPEEVSVTPNATVCRVVPHGLVLDRAVCAVTHGGMGATQKALARGVPVCVVPFGRDQFEVARRVEVARCGTRLAAKKMSANSLRAKVREAMGMADGARRVADGFAATGGVAHGADLFEKRVLSRDGA